jgi:chemotaxis protein MotB
MRKALLLGLFIIGSLQTGCTTKSNMEKEIGVRESKISDLERDLEARRSEMATKETELGNKDTEISKLQGEIDGLHGQIGENTENVDSLNQDLQSVLGNLQDKEKLWLQEKEGMSTITMPNAATFGSGSTQLTAEGKAIIDTVWTVLVRYPDRDIFIEGHTDSIPIGGGLRERFASNWELSAARATAVLQYVLSKHAAEARRLAAVGYGEFRPITPNATEEGRTMNRRVVISVRPQPEQQAMDER